MWYVTKLVPWLLTRRYFGLAALSRILYLGLEALVTHGLHVLTSLGGITLRLLGSEMLIGSHSSICPFVHSSSSNLFRALE